jgi:hypothetical protein
MRGLMLSPRYLWGAILTAGIVGAILTLAGFDVAPRGPLVIVFLIAAPALAMTGLLRGIDRSARVIVALSSAVVLDLLVAETMLATGAWSPRAGLAVIAGLSAIIAAIGFRSHFRLATNAATPAASGGEATARS